VARRNPQPRDTQNRLKNAAAEVFTTRGYSLSGVDHIVEQAGTTRGAFYYYFASKADVARDIQEELWTAAGSRAAEVVEAEADFLTKARRGLEVYLAALKDLGPERAFLQQSFAEPSLVMFDGEGKKWGRHFVRDLLIEAMDNGEIPRQDPERPTSLLVEALQALTRTALDNDDVTDALRVIEELNEALVAGEFAEVGRPS